MNLEVGEHIIDPSIVLSDYEISGVLIVKKRKFDVVDEQEEVHAQEQEAVVVESEVSSEATEEYNSESDIEKELDINNEEEEEEVEIVGVNVPPLKNVAVPHKAISGTYRKVKPDNEFFRVIADQLYGDERWCLVIRHFCYHYLQLKFPKMCFLRKFAFNEEVYNYELECDALSNAYHLQIVVLNTSREIIQRFGDETWNSIYVIAKKNGRYSSIVTSCSVPISDVFTTEYKAGCFENYILQTKGVDIVLPHTINYTEEVGKCVTLKNESEAVILDSIFATRNMLPLKLNNKKNSSYFYYKLRLQDGTERWYSLKKIKESDNPSNMQFISKRGRKVMFTNFYRPQAI